MIEGSNDIFYTPVDAYAVMPMAEGIISGGGGGEETVVQNTRFSWVYNPDSPATSGFTGSGNWYCKVPNTPLANITESQLLEEFQSGRRTDLNAEFKNWQTLVSSQGPGTDYVKDFMKMVGFDCFSTNG